MFDDGEIEEICSAVQDVATALGVSDKCFLSEDTILHTLFEALDMVGGNVSVAVGSLV